MLMIAYFKNTWYFFKENAQIKSFQIKIVEIVLENDVLFEREIDLRF